MVLIWYICMIQVFGSITKPLIEAVLLRHAKPMVSDVTEFQSLEELRFLFLENGGPSEQGQDDDSHPRRRSLRMLMTYPAISIHYMWRKFDDRFMRPVFGGRGFFPFVPGSPTEENETHETSWVDRFVEFWKSTRQVVILRFSILQLWKIIVSGNVYMYMYSVFHANRHT